MSDILRGGGVLIIVMAALSLGLVAVYQLLHAANRIKAWFGFAPADGFDHVTGKYPDADESAVDPVQDPVAYRCRYCGDGVRLGGRVLLCPTCDSAPADYYPHLTDASVSDAEWRRRVARHLAEHDERLHRRDERSA